MVESRLVSWEVQNFASIEHGRCEFDESGIISIVGYNDSGKSNMRRALGVLFFNSYPKDQILFIMDGKDYFRVTAQFSDGVIILRDKYINGQSLYEMYKDGECIYTSKVNNVLTKIEKVPEPIEIYLGLSETLSIRTCYDKQFIVQTTGSENYRSLSTELRTEELVSANELINTDKNKLGADISSKRSFLLVHQGIVEQAGKLTDELITSMEVKDKELDTLDIRLKELGGIETIQAEISDIVITPELDILDGDRLFLATKMLVVHDEINGIKLYPEVQEVDTSSLGALNRLLSIVSAIDNLVITPQLEQVDTGGLNLLRSLIEVENELSDLHVPPELSLIDGGILQDIASLASMHVDTGSIQPEVSFVDMAQLSDIKSIISIIESIPETADLDSQIEEIRFEMLSLAKQADDNAIICPDCGYLITGDELHLH